MHDAPGVKCWHPDVLAYYSIGAGGTSPRDRKLKIDEG